jgi:hypothetical protein
MRPTHDVHVEQEMEAAAHAVWDRISDHASTHTWVHPARVRLLSPGQPEANGAGAMREVSFPGKRLWSTIQERVVAYDPPRSFSYTVTRGMPGLRDHLGTLTVEPLSPARSRLTWHVDFDFAPWHPMGWFARPFTRAFRRVLTDALAELASQLAFDTGRRRSME